MKKRILSALLLAATVLMAACSSGGTTSTDTTTAADTTTAETTTAETRITPDIPEDTDLGGYNFKVYTKGTTNVHWKSIDIAASEQNGDPINDAVFERNSTVGERYNFTVEDIPMATYGAWTTDIANFVLAGDNAYDMICFNVAGSITNGYIYNLYDVPTMDLDMPYYDQNVKEMLTLGGKLYAITGDMLIMDNNATMCVQFNKKLENDYSVAKSLGADSLYDLVSDGKWTMDKLYESGKSVAKDLDGNGKMEHTTDQWGLQTEDYNYMTMLNGGGEFLAVTDSDGYPRVALGGERVVSVLEMADKIQKDTTFALNASTISSGYTDVWSEVIDKNFIEGRVLYSMAAMNRVTLFRPMDTDFGVLPVPKYDEAQDKYYCNVSDYTSNFIAFPATMVEAERNGIIVEALSCESMYTLTPAYYDITLEGKAVRDEESKEMIDIILDSAVFDLGRYLSLSTIYNAILSPSTFASNLAAAEESAVKAIDAAMEVILK